MSLEYVSENIIMREMWANEYNEKYLNLKSNQITVGSGKEDVGWVCNECKRFFIKKPNSLYTNLKRGEKPCPFCSGRMVSFKDSLLAFLMRKSLLERYDFERSFKEEGIVPLIQIGIFM